jgi:hypothetical protein
MKPLDKKDMPKLYALGGLAACIFGYAVYQFAAGGGSTATASAKVAKGAKASPAPGAAAGPTGAGPIAAGTTPGAPGTPGGAASPTAAGKAGGITGTMVSTAGGIAPFDAALVGPPSGGKDPFMPVGKAAQAKTGVSAPAPARTTAVPSFTPIAAAPRKTGLDQLLDMAQQKMGPGNPSAARTVGSPTGGPVVLPPPPPPDMVVTGVVLGDVSTGAARNVAIMRGKGGDGKDERRFVSVGDPLGNGFTVTAVHADGVDIKDKTRNITLKIGSAGDNARAK